MARERRLSCASLAIPNHDDVIGRGKYEATVPRERDVRVLGRLRSSELMKFTTCGHVPGAYIAVAGAH